MTVHSHFPAAPALAPLFEAALRSVVPVAPVSIEPVTTMATAIPARAPVSAPAAVPVPVPAVGQFDSICALIGQVMGVASVSVSIGDTQVAGEGGVFAAHLEVPLLRDGLRVGSLRALDRTAREFTPSERALLDGFARLTVEQYVLWEQASRDPLTSAMTRRAFTQTLDQALARARRKDEAVSVIMFDLDHFKSVNDTHGHAAGDAVLRRVGQVVAAELRTEDSFGRLGGEEFAILVQADAATALEIAERIRRTVALASAEGFGEVGFTASFGVAEAGDATASTKGLLADADGALYAAKNSGRNCVYLAGADSAQKVVFN